MPAQTMEPPQFDDEVLVARAQRDDADAFQQIFDRYYPMIHAYCYRTCLDQTAAQDIAQETFIKAARALNTFRGGATFKGWLYRIATNTTRDWQRQQVRESKLTEVISRHWNEEAEPVDTGESPEDHTRVAEALRALPQDLREAVVLIYYEEMNHAAAARILGCAETTVSWRIFRAKQKLKKLLSKTGRIA